jgi:hexosaminidase
MYRRLRIESLRLEAIGLQHISEQAVSLRQLARSEQIGPLELFVSVIEPVTFDERAQTQRPNQLTPLNQLVDAVSADPPSRHNFEVLVRAYLLDPTMRFKEETELTIAFKSWIAAEPQVLRLLAGSPRLDSAELRVQQLAELGNVGMEAVSYLSSGLPAPAGWKAARVAILEEAEKPQALVRFTIIKPLRDLVQAVPEATTNQAPATPN